MPIRKNKKRIDPRYFLNETTYRDEIADGTIDEGFFSGIGDKLGMQTQDTQARARNAAKAYERIANEYGISDDLGDMYGPYMDEAEEIADRSYEPAEDKASLLKAIQRVQQAAGAGKYTGQNIENFHLAHFGDANMPPSDSDVGKRLAVQAARVEALLRAFMEIGGKKAAASAQYAKEQAKASIEKHPEYKAILKAKNDVRGFRTSDPLDMFSAEDLEKVLRQAGTSKQFIQALVKAGYIDASKLQSSYDIRLR